MVTVKIILKLNKINSAGEAPLYIRMTKERQAKFISLGIKILPEQWNEQERKVKKSHPNSQRLNRFIAAEIAKVEGLALDMESTQKPVNSKTLKEVIKGEKSESFLKYAEIYLQDLDRNNQIGTYRRAKSIIDKLKAYVNYKDVTFADLTVSFLKEYERYLREKVGNKTNTIHLNLKVFRRIINEAIREGLVEPENNPYLKFKLKLEKTNKVHLTEEQLLLLEELQLEPNRKKFHHRNMYVFAAYAGGLRVSDILQLKWSNFDGERILLDTQKTGSTVSIKLPRKAIQILELYKLPISKPGDFIFPILKPHRDYTDLKVLFNSLSSATAYANKDIRTFGKEIGVVGNLSFHSSRHTWATRALRKGMRIEYVSKLMGHSSIKTTQIYAKIVSEELDKAMDVFN